MKVNLYLTGGIDMEEVYQKSLIVHEQLRGKMAIHSKMPIHNMEDLSIAYTPGVAEPCRKIAKDISLARIYTIKHNTVAVVTDGSAVLGLGNIGAYGALPVMEGKAILFKRFADIDAWPLCLDTQDSEEIIRTIRLIAPVFGGINLEDIASPRCFEIEAALQDLGIPVFHDDQHGTAIVLLAGLLNACQVVGKALPTLRVVINGAGAAGIAIAKLLTCTDVESVRCVSVKELIVCDSRGIIHTGRTHLNEVKRKMLDFSNPEGRAGSLKDALKGADVFIGVSQGNILTQDDVRSMAESPIVFAMANPIPEIMPDKAKAAGTRVVGTGRSDFPNQVNNVLAFPGIFRGALDAKAERITNDMKMAAAFALADMVKDANADQILPHPLSSSVVPVVAEAVCRAAVKGHFPSQVQK